MVGLVSAALAACAAAPDKETAKRSELAAGDLQQMPAPAPAVDSDAAGAQDSEEALAADEEEDVPQAETVLYPGTGKFVMAARKEQAEPAAAGDITLNFENTNIREVVKVILGDLLGVNYILYPQVNGGATLQTGRPLRREDLLPTLETLLRMNGAALVLSDGVYRVMPLANAMRGTVVPQLGDSSRPIPSSYSLQVVPLKYISATEMNQILEPLAPQGSIIRVDSVRNLLLLAGTSPEITNLLETIRVFDVDWMEGLSVAFFALEYAQVGDVMDDLEKVFGDEAKGPLAGLLRVVPVEAANGILIISPQAKYLDEAKTWIERLDRLTGSGRGGSAQRLYVYRVKNGEAEDLADILTQLFSAKRSETGTQGPKLAPGLVPTSVGSPTARDKGSALRERDTQVQRPTAMTLEGGEGATLGSEVSIVADPANNSLLVMATPLDYERILAALKKLDIIPLQVLIEATIVEVGLTDEFEFGLQWTFSNDLGGGRRGVSTLDGPLDDADSPGLGQIFPGFNWTWISPGGNVKAVLSALAGETSVNVLSAPSVMVLDNREARIQVGDQVPIATSQQQQTDVTRTVVNNIEYRDTGIMLNVRPRVNPGGLVIMDIEQEVSDAVSTESSALDSPTIQTRNITSSVAIQSGEMVVLGGLIRDRSTSGETGIPWLKEIPTVGFLFKQETQDARRTELLVLLSPSVIGSSKDAQGVVDDFRRKLRGFKDFKTLGPKQADFLSRPPASPEDGGR